MTWPDSRLGLPLQVERLHDHHHGGTAPSRSARRWVRGRRVMTRRRAQVERQCGLTWWRVRRARVALMSIGVLNLMAAACGSPSLPPSAATTPVQVSEPAPGPPTHCGAFAARLEVGSSRVPLLSCAAVVPPEPVAVTMKVGDRATVRGPMGGAIYLSSSAPGIASVSGLTVRALSRGWATLTQDGRPTAAAKCASGQSSCVAVVLQVG